MHFYIAPRNKAIGGSDPELSYRRMKPTISFRNLTGLPLFGRATQRGSCPRSPAIHKARKGPNHRPKYSRAFQIYNKKKSQIRYVKKEKKKSSKKSYFQKVFRLTMGT